MELDEMRKAEILAYCRIDPGSPDELLIPGMYTAAVAYLTGAGVPAPTDTGRKAQYDLCVNVLVLDLYDRRDMTITGTILADNPGFRRMLTQLKLTEPAVSDSDTTGVVS